MELTKEQAVSLHKQMWTAMQAELGDSPNPFARDVFKAKWCAEKFPKDKVENNCFLCEFVFRNEGNNCARCPVVWGFNSITYGSGCMNGNVRYRTAPISAILALPERAG